MRNILPQGIFPKLFLAFFGLSRNLPLLSCFFFSELSNVGICENALKLKVFEFVSGSLDQFIRRFMSPLESYILSALCVNFLLSPKTPLANLSLTFSFALIFTLLYDFYTIQRRDKYKRIHLLETLVVYFSSFLAMMTIFKSNPLAILDNFLVRMGIGLYWLAMLVMTGIFAEIWLLSHSLNSQRKFYHLLSVLLFTPALYFDVDFLKLAMSIALNLFVAVEYYRINYGLVMITERLERNLKKQESNGGLIVAHIQLLLGCALPVWLCESKEAAMTGMITLGIGDAMASIIGLRFGKHRMFNGTKSVEGLLAFILSCWIMRALLSHSLYSFLVDVCLGLLEALLPSDANDSIILSVAGMIIVARNN